MVHDLLHKVLGDAVQWGLLTANPVAAVDAPKREAKQLSPWSPEEVSMFLQSMTSGQGGNYRNLLVFLLASGCRIGEALGLRWSEVNWEQSTVKIKRQLVEVRGQMIEGCP